jgi:hypothetical protein
VRGIWTWFLATEPGARKDLIGIRDIVRVEAAAHSLHGIEVGLRVHIAQGLLLVPAHSMFSRDRASMVDAEMEYACRKFEGKLLLAGD